MQGVDRSHLSIDLEVYCSSSYGMQAIPKAATAAETAVCLLPSKPPSRGEQRTADRVFMLL